MKNPVWRFRRPYCSPGTGFVVAPDKEKAIKLVHRKYGFVLDTTVKKMKPSYVGVLD